MASLDEIFYKEFTQMMQVLKANNGVCNLTDIPLPPEVEGKFFIETRKKVRIDGITEDYYSKLNGTEALLWGNSAMRRRKFDYQGNFIKDDNGKFVLEEVSCKSDSVGVISPLSLHIPTSYKSVSGSQYVDMVERLNERRFVYIIPKRNCYPINQTALVISWYKQKKFYTGVELSLCNGSRLYMYVVPYKPSSTERAYYRVLHCKASVDYTEEITLLRDFWIKTGVMFDPSWCVLDEIVRGRSNMAFMPLDGTEDMYTQFGATRPLADEDFDEDIEFFEDE